MLIMECDFHTRYQQIAIMDATELPPKFAHEIIRRWPPEPLPFSVTVEIREIGRLKSISPDFMRFSCTLEPLTST